MKWNRRDLVDFRYVLEVDLMGFIDGLFMKGERKKEDMFYGFLI